MTALMRDNRKERWKGEKGSRRKERKKKRNPAVYRSSDSRSRIDAFLSLALASLIRKPKPFLLLSRPPLTSERPPEASPTVAHSSRISFVQAVHSLKRCSLLCLPFSHHQQMSLSVHPHFSLRKRAIMACPLRSWSLMPSLDPGVGNLKTLFPASLSSMSLHHLRVARSVFVRFR